MKIITDKDRIDWLIKNGFTKITDLRNFIDNDILSNEIKKPEQLIDPDLSGLRSICNEHINSFTNDNYCDDNDDEHYIYEEALKCLYGKDIFEYINRKLNEKIL